MPEVEQCSWTEAAPPEAPCDPDEYVTEDLDTGGGMGCYIEPPRGCGVGYACYLGELDQLGSYANTTLSEVMAWRQPGMDQAQCCVQDGAAFHTIGGLTLGPSTFGRMWFDRDGNVVSIWTTMEQNYSQPICCGSPDGAFSTYPAWYGLVLDHCE